LFPARAPGIITVLFAGRFKLLIWTPSRIRRLSSPGKCFEKRVAADQVFDHHYAIFHSAIHSGSELHDNFFVAAQVAGANITPSLSPASIPRLT
jgi:hypothetical protein